MPQGSGRSFERFLVDREGSLLRTAVFLVGDRDLGEDLLQDVLLRAYRHWRGSRTRTPTCGGRW